jgi:cytochrome b subunit of formate dehydrogenase
VEGIGMTSVTEAISTDRVAEEKVTRFDIHQIIQHALLMVSFILLVVTGVPQKFHDLSISQWWIGVWGGIEAVRSVHHFAAWVMVIVCVYHLLYLGYTTLILKRPFPIKMIPSSEDFTKFFQEMGYFLGLRKEKPKWDRFNWREKFDYWAIFWGMPVMAGSGLILMYPVLATKFLPGWIVPTALVAHSDEAMLALIWIGGGVALYQRRKQTNLSKQTLPNLVCSLDFDCPPGFACVNGYCLPSSKA